MLERLESLDLPDAWLVSGCLFQTACNVLAGLPPGRGIRDYDIFYFDGADLSAETEQRINHRVGGTFAELDCETDVRNQARVHTWYAEEFGVEDVLNRIVRPNPWFPQAPRDCYMRKSARWIEMWPELQVEPPP